MIRNRSIEDVRDIISKSGYTVLSDSYSGYNKKLELRCPQGHKYVATFGKFVGGRRCPHCSGKARKVLPELKEEFNRYGYTLLEKCYKNSSTPMWVECPNKHRLQMNWDNFKYGQRCPSCQGRGRLTEDTVRPKVEGAGFKFISLVERPSGRKVARVMCCNDHVTEKNIIDFSKGGGCRICSGKDKKTVGYVRQQFAKHGYALLSEEYVNGWALLDYTCSKGHKGKIRWFNFRAGNRCPKCSRGNISIVSQKWLDKLEIPDLKRESCIRVSNKRYRVDGFDTVSNTVYEFLGDFWHGNPACFEGSEKNAYLGKTFSQLYEETRRRLELIGGAGYNIKVVWETDFNHGIMFSDL